MATPSKSFHLVSITKTTKLPDPIKADGILIFLSSELNLSPNPSTNGGIDNTALNLISPANDFLLHISIRRKENAIVFNSHAAGKGWGPEERVTLKGRFDGVNTTIAVYDHGDRYQVLTNGKTAIYYNKRLEGEVSQISYNVNEGQAPVFGNTVAVETYKDWAALVPGSD